ncbi:MAG TPA: head maturation protease, ClpP-related [Terriglobales bacterium]|nr:head maturation protease, ClpP-related [Terriglobales bacterium]
MAEMPQIQIKMTTLLRKGTKVTSFKAQANAGELVLEMYDIIGADFFGEGITVNSVSDALQQNPGYASITCRINSPGGDLFQGVAIYNLLKSQGKPVTCIVDGLAASAASLILMAGDKRQMGQGSMVMIHNAMAVCAGNSKDMRDMGDLLDTVSASAAEVYVAATGLDKKQVQKMMDAETWMGAKECMDCGMATGMSSDDNDGDEITNKFDLSIYNNVPDALKVKAEATAPEPPAAEPEYVEDPSITLTRLRLELLKARA